MSGEVELKADPCPCGKNVRVGVWLEGQEVGCVYLEVHNFMANCKGKARYCEDIGQAVNWIKENAK